MITVVFDLDGVIYRGDETMPGAPETLASLRNSGCLTGFLTNNSTRSRDDYVSLLGSHSIPSQPHEIMTSGEATVRYLLEHGHKGKRIYIIGGAGLVSSLKNAGFITDTNDDGDPCNFVIVGWDRQISFNKIARAQHEILEHGASFIATNTDAVFPAKGGRFLPGAGTMVAAIETATGTKAEVIGKPNTISLLYLLDELGLDSGSASNEVWVVGDRLDTDIACGNAIDAITVCVTTGISSRIYAENASGKIKPDHVIDSITELPDLVFPHA